MTESEAIEIAEGKFGLGAFAEEDSNMFYVGRVPNGPGAYIGYSGRSWEEAFALADTGGLYLKASSDGSVLMVNGIGASASIDSQNEMVPDILQILQWAPTHLV